MSSAVVQSGLHCHVPGVQSRPLRDWSIWGGWCLHPGPSASMEQQGLLGLWTRDAGQAVGQSDPRFV